MAAVILISKFDFDCLVFVADDDAALVGAVSACYKSVAVSGLSIVVVRNLAKVQVSVRFR